MSSSTQIAALAVTATAMLLVTCAVQASRKAWRNHQDTRDLALGCAAVLWLLHLVVSTTLEFAAEAQPLALNLRSTLRFAAHVGYQAVIVSVVFFLLACAGIQGAALRLLLLTQAVAGTAALYFLQADLASPWTNGARPPAYQAWITINLLCSSVGIAVMGRRSYLSDNSGCWLSLAASIVGLGLFIDGIWLDGNAPHFSTLSHYCYAVLLFVMWRLLTWHVPPTATESAFSDDFENSSQLAAPTNFGAVSDAAASAVASERRRIAQDLHDGLGSQIVAILSTLNWLVPGHKSLALALEQCLIDLKMTIDANDSDNDTLPDALGRLRYRVQHCLDKLGISMDWNVEMCTALEAVRGTQAQHALRIAQESLANVMRHARASKVRLSCCYLAGANQVVLEVRDNGQGIARHPKALAGGKGLKGMQQRALAAGGKLRIASKTGMGTRVKFMLQLGETDGPGLKQAGQMPASQAQPAAGAGQLKARIAG